MLNFGVKGQDGGPHNESTLDTCQQPPPSQNTVTHTPPREALGDRDTLQWGWDSTAGLPLVLERRWSWAPAHLAAQLQPSRHPLPPICPNLALIGPGGLT